ncbi:hypothetical protein ES703_97188 [subsurface metagenome]
MFPPPIAQCLLNLGRVSRYLTSYIPQILSSSFRNLEGRRWIVGMKGLAVNVNIEGEVPKPLFHGVEIPTQVTPGGRNSNSRYRCGSFIGSQGYVNNINQQSKSPADVLDVERVPFIIEDQCRQSRIGMCPWEALEPAFRSGILFSQSDHPLRS